METTDCLLQCRQKELRMGNFAISHILSILQRVRKSRKLFWKNTVEQGKLKLSMKRRELANCILRDIGGGLIMTISPLFVVVWEYWALLVIDSFDQTIFK